MKMKRIIIFLAVCVSFVSLSDLTVRTAFAQENQDPGDPIKERDFSHLFGMDGFSEEMLADHLALYRGYVFNSNAVLSRLDQLLKEGGTGTAEYAELKRRLAWEMNGMKLHEYYFGNLGGEGIIDETGELYARIEKDFGSFAGWKKDFVATGSIRGIGWVVLGYDPSADRLVNLWIEQHDTGHFSGFHAILVMDVFEHAYITDYRLDRAAYIESFFDNIDWTEVHRRFESGIS